MRQRLLGKWLTWRADGEDVGCSHKEVQLTKSESSLVLSFTQKYHCWEYLVGGGTSTGNELGDAGDIACQA